MRVIQQKEQRDPLNAGRDRRFTGHAPVALKAGVPRQQSRTDKQTGFADAKAGPAVGKIAAKIRERAARLNVGLQCRVQLLRGRAMRKADTAHPKDKSEDREEL